MEQACAQCPRRCGVDRNSGNIGYCGVPWDFYVARAALHPWEEPSVSGKNGSGTIFFSGCNLRCVFCQNREISHESLGQKISKGELIQLMLRLRDKGAHNINLVTPTHYALQLANVLEEIKPALGIPVVYNCGGYESADTLKHLEGLVDVYLPDFKYFSTELSSRYSGAADYFPIARSALTEMLRQTGKPQFDGDGLITRGVILRHLVLPGNRADSMALLRNLAEHFGTDSFLLSLMSQYTPNFAHGCPYPELHRRLTTFEYNSVLNLARSLGFDGYFQSPSSASSAYTPNFHEPLELT